jgi:hypothetical protein
MKWSGSESQETPAPASGMLGNGSHATPLQTVSEVKLGSLSINFSL